MAKDNILIWGAGQSVYDFLDACQMSENVRTLDNNKAYEQKNGLLVYHQRKF